MGVWPSRNANALPPQKNRPSALLKKKVVVLGVENAGKTSLVQKMKYGQPVSVKPTIGFNLENFKQKDIELMLFDIAGGARSMWPHYLENADVIIYVIDATRHDIFDLTRELLRTINREMRARRCLFVCALNKSDLPGAMTNQQFLADTNIAEIIDADLILTRTSTVTGEGIMDIVNKINGYFGGKWTE